MTAPATRHRGPGFGAEVDLDWTPITRRPPFPGIARLLVPQTGLPEPSNSPPRQGRPRNGESAEDLVAKAITAHGSVILELQ
jgi:hypothetical protein